MLLAKKIFKFHAWVQKGPPNPGFMQEKVQKVDFLKKGLARIDFFCFVFGSYESLEGLEH